MKIETMTIITDKINTKDFDFEYNIKYRPEDITEDSSEFDIDPIERVFTEALQRIKNRYKIAD